MAAYTYMSENDFKNYTRVSNKETNELLNDVRLLMPGVYVQEISYAIPKLFRKDKIVTVFAVYHRIDKGRISGTEEVRVLNLSFKTIQLLDNYLFGLYNGYQAALNTGSPSSSISGE